MKLFLFKRQLTAQENFFFIDFSPKFFQVFFFNQSQIFVSLQKKTRMPSIFRLGQSTKTYFLQLCFSPFIPEFFEQKLFGVGVGVGRSQFVPKTDLGGALLKPECPQGYFCRFFPKAWPFLNFPHHFLNSPHHHIFKQTQRNHL